MGEPPSGGSLIVYNSFRRFAGRRQAGPRHPAKIPPHTLIYRPYPNGHGTETARTERGVTPDRTPVRSSAALRPAPFPSIPCPHTVRHTNRMSGAGYGRLPKRLPVSGEPRFSGRYIRYLIYSLVYQTCPAVISRCRLCGAAGIEYGRQPRTKGTNRKSVRENQRRIIGMPYMPPVLIRDRVRFRSAPAVRLFGPSA